MRKRLLGILLTITMILQIAPLSAFAENSRDFDSNITHISEYSSEDQDYIPGLVEYYEYLRQQGIDPEAEFPMRPDFGNVVDLLYEEPEQPRHESFTFNQSNSAELLSNASAIIEQHNAVGASSNIVRYNVLVIDVSGSMAGTPIHYARVAAQRFVDAALAANGTNYVAIVAFGASGSIRQNFTTNPTLLRTAIGGLNASGGTNMAGGLQLAEGLLSNVTDAPNVVKNLLLLSDGLPNQGASSNTGPFSSPQPSWQFANGVYHVARRIMDNGVNMYSLGFFHGLSGATLNFARYFKGYLQNKGYYDVVNPGDLEFVFDDIIQDIFNVPIVVIPGIAGTEFRNPENRFRELVWIAYTWHTQGHIEQLALDTNGEPVVSTVYHVTTGYGADDTYKKLIEGLRDEYDDDSVHFFAYDWRLNNAVNAERLKKFIDDLGASRVDIVAHSMGGLIASRYIADGNGSKIRRLITLGTPYLGAPKAAYVFATGELINAPLFLPGPRNGVRNVSSHMTSAYQLLPYRSNYHYIGIGEKSGALWWSELEWEPVPNEFNYIRDSLPMQGVGNSNVPSAVRASFLEKSPEFMNTLFIGNTHVIETVESYVIVGANQPTIHTTIFDKSNKYIENFTFMQGDGTVPLWSANINERIEAIPVQYDHTKMVKQDSVIKMVIEALNGQNTEGEGDTNGRPFIVIRIASPVKVTITHDGETLSSVEELFNTRTSFGSLYFLGLEEESELLTLNTDNVYDVRITGTGHGTMNYHISFFDKDGNLLEERAFHNVPISPDTIITTNTDQNEETTLSVDTNGSGVFDYSLFPSVNVPDQDNTYSLTIVAQHGGRIIEGENGSHEEGSIIDISAEANNGFVFTHWSSSESDAFTNANNEATSFTMPANPTIVMANFSDTTSEGRSFNIVASAGVGGRVTGGGNYDAGAVVTLVATPNTNYAFEGWYEQNVKISGGGSTYIFNANADRTLEARFTYLSSSGNNTRSGGSGVGFSPTAATLSISEATFNKSTPKDIVVTLIPGGSTLREIKNGEYTLIRDEDYSVSGNIFTIKAKYLSTLDSDKAILTFHMRSGSNPTLEITFETGEILQTVIILTIGKETYTVGNTTMVMDVAPFIEDGRTMVPLRFIAESLGASVAWNDASRTVTIVYEGKTLSLVIETLIPGMDVAPFIRNDRTFVQTRYIMEYFGTTVDWDEATQTVTITK